MQLRNWLLGKTDFTSASSYVGLALIRISMGLFLAFAHGLHKLPPTEKFTEIVGMIGFPLPSLFAWIAAGVEFFGGLLLAVGLLTRPAALFITINMIVAAFMRHADDPFSVKEKALLYLIISILFVFIGPGKYSIDSLFQGKKS